MSRPKRKPAPALDVVATIEPGTVRVGRRELVRFAELSAALIEAHIVSLGQSKAIRVGALARGVFRWRAQRVRRHRRQSGARARARVVRLLLGGAMTTLITVSNSEGVVGRCDAKCYDAKSPQCDCICGGRNHGAGKDVALGNVTEDMLGVRSVAEFAAKHGFDPAGLTARVSTQQRELAL